MTKTAAEPIVSALRTNDAEAVRGPGVGVEIAVLQEPVAGAVKFVAAALGDQNSLAAGGAAETRGVVAGGNAELLDTFHRRRDGALRAAVEVHEVIAVGGGTVGDVAAIEHYGVLIAVRAGAAPP